MLQLIPSLDHPLARAGMPNDARFVIGNGTVVFTGNELRGLDVARSEGRCTRFMIGPLGIERWLDWNGEQVVERIVVAPAGNSACIEWSTGNHIWAGDDSGTAAPARWVQLHAAAAERRRKQDLAFAVAGTDIAEAIEWAKYRAATLPNEPEGDAARAVVDNLTHHILRIVADSERGRLRIAPVFQEEWRHALAENIRIDDAAITMRFDYDGGTSKFTFSQTSGAYPIRLIFEPALPQAVKHAFVDGAYAELNVRNEAGRIVAPVQIMLDAPREVSFEH